MIGLGSDKNNLNCTIQKSQTPHPSFPEILKSRPSAVHGHLNHICKKKLVVEGLKWYLRTACHCVYVAWHTRNHTCGTHSICWLFYKSFIMEGCSSLFYGENYIYYIDFFLISPRSSKKIIKFDPKMSEHDKEMKQWEQIDMMINSFPKCWKSKTGWKRLF